MVKFAPKIKQKGQRRCPTKRTETSRNNHQRRKWPPQLHASRGGHQRLPMALLRLSLGHLRLAAKLPVVAAALHKGSRILPFCSRTSAAVFLPASAARTHFRHGFLSLYKGPFAFILYTLHRSVDYIPYSNRILSSPFFF